jgi:phosphohistidine swiveling domain-containing protein
VVRVTGATTHIPDGATVTVDPSTGHVDVEATPRTAR